LASAGFLGFLLLCDKNPDASEHIKHWRKRRSSPIVIFAPDGSLTHVSCLQGSAPERRILPARLSHGIAAHF
jgi:hypothetical protein